MSLRLAILLASVGLAAAAAAFYLLVLGEEDRTELTASSMTVEQLYAAVDERIAENDGILYLRSRMSRDGPYKASGTTERWIEPNGPVVRDSTAIEAMGERTVVQNITTSKERFIVNARTDGGHVADSRFWQCAGGSVAAAAILPCPGASDEFERRVEEGTWNGRKVIALIEHGTTSGEGRSTVTTRTYLDADTLMPIRRESLSVRPQLPVPFTSVEDFDEVDDDASVSADFFEPASIGYVVPDPLAALKAVTDLQAYWLGLELTLPSGEVLVLTGGYEVPAPGRPYRLSLQYATSGSPHYPPFITVMVFHRDMWERSPAIRSQAVTFGDVVVFVNAQSSPDQRSLVAPPNSYEFLLSRLKPFEP